MKAIFRIGPALLLASLLGACITMPSGPEPIDVTRHHLGQPIARAQIAVEPADKADANDPEFRAYADAVARQLSALGWTVTPSGQSEQIALIDVEQGLGTRLARGTDLMATTLRVSIRRRSDATVFWEGRAQTEAQPGSPEANRALAVERLAAALFQGFPGESGRTIRLP